VRQVSYQKIRDEVLARIHAHVWQAGDLIPSEADLAAEFGCARATVNRALRELAETGLIERRRKAGTRVSKNPVRKATLDISLVRREVEGRGQRYRHRLLLKGDQPAPDHVSARMSLPARQDLLHLKTLHLADDLPYMFEDRWINRAAAAGIENAPLEALSANEWLVQNIPISGGDITFLAAPASAEEAGALNIETGAALFVIERITWRMGAAVTVTRLCYPPGYRMTTQI